jgi:hypothetical protein
MAQTTSTHEIGLPLDRVDGRLKVTGKAFESGVFNARSATKPPPSRRPGLRFDCPP